MSLIILANFLTLLIMLFLWIVMFSFIETYRDDSVRQKLFAIRDELFDLAADGKISFDSEAYKDLRFTINGAIRFVHRLRFHRFIILRFALKYSGVNEELDEYRSIVKSDFNRLPQHQQELLNSIKGRMAITIVSHIIRTSFLLAPFIAFGSLIIGLFRVLKIRKLVAVITVIVSRVDTFAGQKASKSKAYDLANAEMFNLGKELAAC